MKIVEVNRPELSREESESSIQMYSDTVGQLTPRSQEFNLADLQNTKSILIVDDDPMNRVSL